MTLSYHGEQYFFGDTMLYNTFLDNKISESEVLIEIENFIIKVINYGFDTSLTHNFKKLLDQFYRIYNVDYYYSKYVSIFVLIKLEIDMMRYDISSNLSENYDFVLHLNNGQLKHLEFLIRSQKESSHMDLYQPSLQAKENTQKIKDYLYKLFHHYSKVLIVRVDLGYSNDSKSQMNLEQFHQHVEKFRNRLSNKDTCFEHLHGYAWSLEQGPKRGYHVHLLLIYNGTKVQNGSYYAQQAGEKWKDITLGHGSYFNLHDQKYINQLKTAGCDIGIGMLSRNNEGDWQRLIPVIEYLTDPNKETQHLRVKCSQNMKTFGTGLFENTTRRGIRDYSLK